MNTKREALLYESLDDGSVRCLTCGHECVIKDGGLGFCGTRTSSGGKCYTLIYGALTAEALDPVEKKPLFHFYPGHAIYSISSLGCSFKCDNCQNYHISQARSTPGGLEFRDVRGGKMLAKYTSPVDLIARVMDSGCELLAFTYNEPLIWIEYIRDVGIVAREHGIKIVLVTNGYSVPRALDEILPYVDAVNVDIKSMDESFYNNVCKVKNFARVLDTIKIMHARGILVEITNLIIPGLNDTDENFIQLSRWVRENIGSETPVHFSAYRPMFRMEIPGTSTSTLVRARSIALKNGLKHVYIGNAWVKGGENTTCPGCGQTVIGRSGYRVDSINLKDDNHCLNCGYELNIRGSAKEGRGSRFSLF
ncbi:MAG: AmmeMemoRadiSam system radical SAM enzyme [Promethearchaeota archaeon]